MRRFFVAAFPQPQQHQQRGGDDHSGKRALMVHSCFIQSKDRSRAEEETMAPYLCIVSFLLLLSCSSALAKNYDVSAVFVFGDSLVDSGNNNNLQSLAKANFLPYGKDFDTHKPTGRFANGRLVPDFIASFLGLPFPETYLSAGDNIDHGLNFASSGAGLLPASGNVFGEHIPLPKQVASFKEVHARLVKKLGPESASRMVSKAIYYITIGSNDLVNNYYLLPGAPLRTQSPQEFQDSLIVVFREQIKTLYGEGARRFVIASLTALGCSPINLLKYLIKKPGECAAEPNDAAKLYNKAVESMLSELRESLPGIKLLHGNCYDMVYKAALNPLANGFDEGDKACCSGIGKNGAIVFCLPDVPSCKDPSRYVYWDEFHPSSRIYEILARNFWSGGKDEIYPMNIQQIL
ncbi:GDSL esterase/lipase At4g16230-like [Selaginella moellendorffii]|uniref:GDSL esterase/lipase At4g16230-like n=1 Tax=Selaginella moellendorffii TaxID=88036 RepID=UPI000D1C393F|nr:GDSL esterase/lipase At4g16230-like [Selaginella moellendorffii]|eukprot:XP_024545336.1 GDSL esterase/lipase At4g16230-like [Selaginella moellendorffii]